MKRSKLKEDFVAVIERGLKDVSNPTVYNRIMRSIEILEENTKSIAKTINNIEIVLRLLVDEDLSEDIAETLRSVARGAGHDI